MTLRLAPITLRDAQAWVPKHHRHHKRKPRGLFAVAVARGDELLGVAIVARPVASAFDPTVFEVTRCCAAAAPELYVCSRLYGAAAGAALRIGYRRGVTYTRRDELGSSLRAANWRPTALVDGREWNTGNKATRWLPGFYEASSEVVDRVRWEIGPDAAPELPALSHLGRRKSEAA